MLHSIISRTFVDDDHNVMGITLVSMPVAGFLAFAIFSNHATQSASQNWMDYVRFNALTCDLGAWPDLPYMRIYVTLNSHTCGRICMA